MNAVINTPAMKIKAKAIIIPSGLLAKASRLLIAVIKLLKYVAIIVFSNPF